jgi:hypothetical protein
MVSLATPLLETILRESLRENTRDLGRNLPVIITHNSEPPANTNLSRLYTRVEDLGLSGYDFALSQHLTRVFY